MILHFGHNKGIRFLNDWNIENTISNKYQATDNKNKKMYHIDFYQNRSKPTASKMHKKLYILNIIDNFITK